MASVPLGATNWADDAPTAARYSDLGMLRVARWQRALTTQLTADWAALERKVAAPNPFYSHWYLRPALHRLDSRGKVKLITLYDGGELLALMPIAAPLSYYDYPLPHSRNWMHANAFCGMPLVARGHETAFWRALLRWADRAGGAALFLHVAGLPMDGPLYSALREVTGSSSRPAGVVTRKERAVLHHGLSSDDHYTQSVTAKKRKELRRQHARLSECGTLSVERLHDDTKLRAWIDEFLSLEAAGWKGAEKSALASDAATRGLFADSLTGAADAGVLERLALRLDGKAIAMLVNFTTKPHSFAFKTTFDENYARYSPGMLLQRENLALLNRDGITLNDSCAAEDHPMIERIWRDRRTVVGVNIAVGGALRRRLFAPILNHEAGRADLEPSP